MQQFIRIGVDLAKNSFQVHALTREGGATVKRKLRRCKFRSFFENIAPCVIGMEACGSAHYWARELAALGHEVKLIAPIYVKPYVKRGKNDAADAEAICEAMSRPGMRFVAVKSVERQAAQMLHKTRDLLIKQRTMCVNALRGHLAEFGLVVAKGVGRVDELLDLAKEDATLPEAAQAGVETLAAMLEKLAQSIDEMDTRIAADCASSDVCRLIDGVPGVGKHIASAIVAMTPAPHAFGTGRDFAAWLGLTPRQNSTGGKQTLGSVTKRGNGYLRRLFVLAATSLLRVVARRKGALADWVAALLAKKPARLVTLALANKIARTVFAMMKTGEAFRAELFAAA